MPANIRDIDAIRQFRAAMIEFIEETVGALEVMAMEMQRVKAWIEQEQPQYWTIQTRRGFDKISEARVSLERCQMRTVAGQRSSCIEEKQAFAAAKRRLQHCHDQIDVVKRWSMKLRHETDEFRGRLSGIRRMLETDLPRALALLEKTAEILESYADVPPPAADN